LSPPRRATCPSSAEARQAQSQHTTAAAEGRPPQSFVGLGVNAGTFRLRAQHRPPRPMGRDLPCTRTPALRRATRVSHSAFIGAAGIRHRPSKAIVGSIEWVPRAARARRAHAIAIRCAQRSMGIATAAHPAVPADPQVRWSVAANPCAAVFPRLPLVKRHHVSAEDTPRVESRAADAPRGRSTSWRGSNSAPSQPGASLHRNQAGTIRCHP